MMMTTAIWTCLFVVLASVATDLTSRRMPNILTLGGVVVGLAIHGAAGFAEAGFMGGLRGVGLSMLGALACGVIPFLSWKKGEMGGGDVKLFAAIGALVGLSMGFDVEARALALSFLIMFPYRLIRHGAVGVALKNARIGIVNLFRSRDARAAYLTGPKLPPVILGPAIGIAFALTLVQNGALR